MPAESREHFGVGNILMVSGDVQNPSSANELVGQLVGRFGRFDGIV